MSKKPTEAESAAAVTEIAKIAADLSGIQLSLRHRSMIESRLFRRISELGLDSLPEYVDHLKTHLSEEKPHLISLLTTHHTYFFREMAHFEFLRDQGLSQVVGALKEAGRSELRVWSAACSRGQEGYSLAMWILPWLAKNAPGIKLKIVGTDVDPESVGVAKNGVYRFSEIAEVPLPLLADHWARGTGDIQDFVKAKKSLKAVTDFRTGNLFEVDPAIGLFDIIFCRNVFIYFNHEQIQQVTRTLLKSMQPSGVLMVGISETLNGLNLPVHPVGASVYRHQAFAKPAAKPTVATPAIAVAPSGPLRVLCVDDSPTVLALLKKVLVGPDFQVVGTCANGKELEARVGKGGIDLITLDIHMPELTGPDYLKKNWKPGHPPVVMVSSVSREEAGLARECLKLGAVDYVEKPALGNLAERSEELRNKLKMAARTGLNAASSKLDDSFAKKSLSPGNGKRVVVICPGFESAALAFARTYQNKASLTFLAGADSVPVIWRKDASAPSLSESWPTSGKISYFIFGTPPPEAVRKMTESQDAQFLLLEGTATVPAKFVGREVHLVPATSFDYHADEYFTRTQKEKAAA